MTRSLALTFALALLAPAASGCAAARVRVDPALSAGAPPLAVTGANPRRWGAPVKFGPHATGPVRGTDTLGWSFALLGKGVAGTHRPYAWTSTGPGGALDAECHQRGLEAFAQGGTLTFDLQGASGRPALACAFRAAAGADAWTLALTSTGKADPAYRGELRGGGATYAVRSVHALEGSPIPLGTPAAFALEQEGRVVAMVETMNAGRVWLPGTPDDGALAAAAVALLLFQPPE